MAYSIDRELYDNGYSSVSTGIGDDGVRRGAVAIKRIAVPSDERYAEVLRECGGNKAQANEYFAGFAEDLSEAVSAMATLSLKNNRVIMRVLEHNGQKRNDPIGFFIDVVTEYLPSLEAYIGEKGLTLGGAVRVGIDACEALKVCHDNGVVHGGIKERNIFVSEGVGKEATSFKLGDIGLSRVIWDPTVNAQDEAAPYTAPEVFKGEYAEESADIYAVGIILFKLFNDMRMPFAPIVPAHTSGAGDNDNAEIRRKSGEIPPLPRKAGERLGAIIRKACGSKDRRHKNAKQLQDELTKYFATLTDAEINSFLIYPPGAQVPGRRAMGQQRATAAKVYDDEDERVTERNTLETWERSASQGISPRGKKRPSEMLAEVLAEVIPDEPVAEGLFVNDLDDEIYPTEVKIERPRRTVGDSATVQPVSQERVRGTKGRGRGTSPESNISQTEESEPRQRGSTTKNIDERLKEAKEKKPVKKTEYIKTVGGAGIKRIPVIILSVIILAGLAFGGYMLYNYLNDPISAFAKHLDEGEYTAAAKVYNDSLAGNEELSIEAHDMLIMKLMASELDFSSGLSTYESALSVVTGIEEMEILDPDILHDFLDQVMQINHSIRAFNAGREFFDSGDMPGAIREFGRVQNFVFAYNAAQSMRESATRQYINDTVSALDDIDGTLESYESALATFADVLNVLPGNAEVLNHISHLQQQYDVLYAAANPDITEPEPTPMPPGMTAVTDMRFNYGVMVGTYTGTVSGSPQRPHGTGTFSFEGSRGTYTGEWHNGLRHGLGRNEFRNGTVYEGQWEEGWFHGTGTFYYTDGHSVTGSNWRRSALTGTGTIRDASGNVVFEGNVDANQERYIRQ